MAWKFDYLIVGNSAGGIGCAETLRSIDKDKKIAMISDEAHHVYSRALIPYYLDGKIDQEKMYYRPLDFYERMNVTTFLGKRAVEIDIHKKEVLLADGERIGYEKLLLATGGKPFIPPLEGLNKNNIFTFVSMENVLGIEKAIRYCKKAVVIGGGVIGLMAAEVLKRKGLGVHVIELSDRLLSPVIDELASEMVKTTLAEKGIEVCTNTTVQKVTGEDRLQGVILTDGRFLPCDLLIIAIGVVPRIELVQGTGMEINRGIVVNKKMQTSLPDIYACGDCAEVYDFIIDERRLTPLWPNAYVGGRIAAFNMAGIEKEYEWGTSMNSMHFFNLYIMNAGLNVTLSEQNGFEVISKIDRPNKKYRKFVLQEGKLKGFILAGEISRAGIFLNLMRSKINVSDFKEELLKDNFGYADIPDHLRWELLKNEVILGVVHER